MVGFVQCIVAGQLRWRPRPSARRRRRSPTGSSNSAAIGPNRRRSRADAGRRVHAGRTAARRLGAASSRSTAGHGGLPQIEPRSLMPQNLFGRDVGFNGGNQPAHDAAGASATTVVAKRRDQSTRSPANRRPPRRATPQSPTYSTARRSPAAAALRRREPRGSPRRVDRHDSRADRRQDRRPIRPKHRRRFSTTLPPACPSRRSRPAPPSDHANASSCRSHETDGDRQFDHLVAVRSRSRQRPSPVRHAGTAEAAEPEPTPANENDRYDAAVVPDRRQAAGPRAGDEFRLGPCTRREERTTTARPPRRSNSTRFPCRPRRPVLHRAGKRCHAIRCRSRRAMRMTGDAADARRESFIKEDQDEGAGPGVLVTNVAPAITSDIRGPKQIAIGREASYRVRLQNQGGSSAEAVVATVRIPSWAEVVNTTATNGVVRQIAADDSAATLQWQIPRLDAQASETLGIDLVPRASRPLELGRHLDARSRQHADRRRSAGAEAQARSHRSGRSALRQVACLSPDAFESRHRRRRKRPHQPAAAGRWRRSGEHVRSRRPCRRASRRRPKSSSPPARPAS